MSTVCKYPLPSPSAQQSFTLEIPEGSCLLHVSLQIGRAYVWACVDPDPSLVKRTRHFEWIATGQVFQDHFKAYVGTVLFIQGYVEFHLYESFPQNRGIAAESSPKAP